MDKLLLSFNQKTSNEGLQFASHVMRFIYLFVIILVGQNYSKNSLFVRNAKKDVATLHFSLKSYLFLNQKHAICKSAE